MPTAADVAAYLDRTDVHDLAAKHLPIVEAMVKSYTRGVGFDETGAPDEAVSAVIVSACARLTSNPDSTISVSVDEYQTRKTVFEGFTLLERIILDNYRRKAA